MNIGSISKATRRIGKSQGFQTLPVRDEPVPGAPDVNQMVTAWTPSQDELALLNKGASIHLILMGTQHPPVIVCVGDVPG